MFLLGSDPEMMLVDKQNKLISAIKVVPEGKGAGRPLERGAVLHDNVLLEFNTDPSKNEKEFVKTNQVVLRQISEMLSKDSLEMRVIASVDYPISELGNEEARLFGCDPDYSAWSLKIQKVPATMAESPFRSAGGHLHIGMSRDNKVNELLGDPLGKVAVVKALDITCGIVSVFLDKDPSAAARRQLYGKAGSHRPKPYGVEYRAMSSWWLGSPSHSRLIYRLAAAAIKLSLVKGGLEELTAKIGGELEVQSIINDSKKTEARAAYNNSIKNLLDEKTQRLVNKIDRNGSPDLYKSWKLNGQQ